MTHSRLSGFRYTTVVVLLMVCFGALFFRLYQLHVIEQDKAVRIVSSVREKFEVLQARRGNVVDRRGNLLATTRAMMELGVDPEEVREEDRARLREMATLLQVDEGFLIERFERGFFTVQGPDGPEQRAIRWRRLAESIDDDTYASVMALGIRGVYGNRKFERIYPNAQHAAHILGFINKENTPVQGVEKYMDYYLRGQSGWRESEKDGRRREMAQFRRREISPSDGLNVEISIDLVIQNLIEREIDRIVAEYSPAGVAIIVSDPSTGFILGMGNYPSFDPNTFWRYPVDHMRNRSITDVFEPGSTFKIVPTAAALNEGLIRPEDRFDCNVTTLDYRGRSLRLPGDHRPHGVLTVSEIVQKSSNPGAVHFGVLLGADRLYDYSRAFGFGERTGFELDQESVGILHPVRRWDGLTISRLPIGHAVSATPLQVHTAMAAIANRGIVMEPRIITRVFDSNNETVVHFNPRPKHRAVSSLTAERMTDMLVKVVGQEGTARRAALPGFNVAGKTGTTQKIIDGRYSSRHHVASFSGFFPAERPRVVITVVVDDASLTGTSYGGVVAAPAFRNLAEGLIHHLGIQPPTDNRNLIAGKGDHLDWIRQP
jgi:cell division protein FtsI/penicillin-binding protein 2